MRWILAGLFLLFIPSCLFAQASGEVQDIGFNGYYRPNCWTPMLVRLKPDTTESGNYTIQIWQHDLDGDRPIYSKSIVLNGSAQAAEQRFWLYFLPEPINKGLPDGSTSVKDLSRDLQVFFCTESGKQIKQLPLTSTLTNVDPWSSSMGSTKPNKLILAVSARGAKPPIGEFNLARGTTENLTIVSLRPRDLPGDPLGYEAVDAIIWLDGDPAELSQGNQDTMATLKDYVRNGGRLVICQSTIAWQEDQNFNDLLPVELKGTATKADLEPLLSMAGPPGQKDPFQPSANLTWPFLPKGPFVFARAAATPGTVVEKWIDWKQDGSDVTPYLVRKSYGLGESTWVAQTLATDTMPFNNTGWPYVWGTVFGWHDDAYVLPAKESPDDELIRPRLVRYGPTSGVDVGYKFAEGLNLDSKSAWLIFLAIAFFLVYWVVAGPGTYGFLMLKKRQQMSWFFFGVAALIATGVTAAVVKLVLRGPPEIKHVSFVRVAPGQPAVAYCRFGLYIPRDGDQTIALSDTAQPGVSYLAPFPEHPQQLGDVSEFPAPAEYIVPIRDLKSDTQPELSVPYRSSLKKFQARWVGSLPARFVGTPKLDIEHKGLPLKAALTNASGVDLTDVFLAWHLNDQKDFVLYVPVWNKGGTFDLQRDFKPILVGKRSDGLNRPGDDTTTVIGDELAPDPIRDGRSVAHGWSQLWYNNFRHGTGDAVNKEENDYLTVFPVASLYDRLPPMSNIGEYTLNNGTRWSNDRVELLNRGVRMINASAAVASGQLLILATAKGPVPVPLSVDGSPVAGDGVTFYQFVLPIDRGNADEPTTKPAR